MSKPADQNHCTLNEAVATTTLESTRTAEILLHMIRVGGSRRSFAAPRLEFGNTASPRLAPWALLLAPLRGFFWLTGVVVGGMAINDSR
jgi:hypothetical protein